MKTLIFIFLFIPIILLAQNQIEGKIYSLHGEAIASVFISITGSESKTISDQNGKFNIQCAVTCTLVFSHVNYETKELKITNSQPLQIVLEEKEHLLEEIEVIAMSTSENESVKLDQIKGQVAVFGESDVIKYLTTLSGVSTINTFDAGISVRGGSTSENMFLVMGLPVADPKHISTIVTSYDSYILGQSKLYKSGYPSMYNGYLSSYIDMNPKHEMDGKSHAELSAGLISSAVKGTTSFGKRSRHSFKIAARKTYFYLISEGYRNKTKDEQIPKYKYSDYSFSQQSDYSNNWSMYSYGLYSFDNMPIALSEGNQYNLNWETKNLILKLKKKFIDGRQLSFGGGYIHNDARSNAQRTFAQNVASANSNFTCQVAYQNQWNSIDFHTSIQYDQKRYTFSSSQPQLDLVNASKNQYDLITSHMSLTYYLTNELTLNAGINMTMFYGNAQSNNWSPRLKISYDRMRWSLWSDYSRTLQFEERLPFFTIRSPIDIYVPLGANNKPAMSNQVSVGARRVLIDGLTLTSSVFYKQLSYLKDFALGDRSDISLSNVALLEGKGKVYGIETGINYIAKKFDVNVNYTYINSKRKFAAINGGREFSPPFDITANISFQGSWLVLEHWRFSAIWSYASGIYVTIPEGIAVAKDIIRPSSTVNFVPIYNERYNYRLPSRHQLGLSLEYFKTMKRDAIKVALGTYNTYGRKNTDFVFMKVEPVDDYLVRFTPQSRLFLGFFPYLTLTYYINNHEK